MAEWMMMIMSAIWYAVLGLCSCMFLQLHSLLSRKLRRLPPGPLGLPVIGNFLQLGNKTNESLQRLSAKYGPLMTLKLGWKTVIVASSREMAREICKSHDKDLAGRDPAETIKAMGATRQSVLWGQPDQQWRMLRRISNLHLFSPAKLQSLQHLRTSQIRLTVAEIFKATGSSTTEGGLLNVRDIALRSTLNMLGQMIFSSDMFSPDSQQFQDFLNDVNTLPRYSGKPNIADFFPILARIDPQGLARRTVYYRDRLYAAFSNLIHLRLAQRGEGQKVEPEKEKDLLDTFLNLCGPDFTISDVYFFLLETFVGGTDTIMLTIEWAMAELIRNPELMKKTQAEIDDVVGCERLIEERDIEKLAYLQAVVKETLRLHPAAPLLIPRRAQTSCEIEGFMIPKNATILINYWAIATDPVVWKEPLEFKPERFLENGSSSSVSFKGHHFELIPFGAGRRICAGLPLANLMIHTMLGAMIQCFNWSPPPGTSPQDIDMKDNFNLTIHKTVPLEASPSPRLPLQVLFS